MNDYDFRCLNDKEFESMAIDLLSEHLSIRIERFKLGKDKGVDGRFFNFNGENIIQCKHYVGSGYKKLIGTVKKAEVDKVKKLNPIGYYFVTSVPLSRKNKKEIKDLFYPYIKNQEDIYGCEDLNQLISTFSKIEERYYKLWISSSNVLKQILNSALLERNEEHLSSLIEKQKQYFKTENHQKALQKLSVKRVLILSGEPGIGKTTLAESLCVHFASNEYQYIQISTAINEAEKVWSRGKKQVFYFDDFLGSNYLESFEDNKDSTIWRFIDRIQRDKNKIFILTSRTNILKNSGLLDRNRY